VASGATARSSTAPASRRASTSSTSFPVLSVGTTPHTPLDAWTFGITGAIDEPVSWKWEELRALPAETPTVDIHCVTAWSRDAVVPSRSPEVQVVLLRIDDDHGMANSTSELR
jgi:DMSO/TMAO reductase YedYZ molybdopterin-dependent catalytic subunit